MIYLYVSAVNADQTEGRGPMKVVGIFTDPESAVEHIRGQGVMGIGDGEVFRIPIEDGKYIGDPRDRKYLFYGYHHDSNGTWRTGYVHG